MSTETVIVLLSNGIVVVLMVSAYKAMSYQIKALKGFAEAARGRADETERLNRTYKRFVDDVDDMTKVSERLAQDTLSQAQAAVARKDPGLAELKRQQHAEINALEIALTHVRGHLPPYDLQEGRGTTGPGTSQREVAREADWRMDFVRDFEASMHRRE